MQIHHLKVFAAVVQAGNYSRAAEQLFISQPAVFHQVRRLEQDLGGTRLFEARGRQLVLTHAGEVVWQTAQRILSLTDETEERIRDLVGGKTGRLRVGASSTPGVYILPWSLARYQSRYPGIRVHWQVANSSRVQSGVLAGDLDIGLTGEVDALDQELERLPIGEDHLVVVGRRERPDWPERPVDAEALARLPLLVREPGSSSRRVLETRLLALGILLQPLQSVSNTEAIRQAAMAGMGFGVITRLAVAGDVMDGRLHEVPLDGLDLRRTLHAVLLRGREPLHEVQKLLQVLDQRLAPDPLL